MQITRLTSATDVSGRAAGIRELERRSSGGIDVRLLWEAMTDRVLLLLTDDHAGESLSFEVDLADALRAFHHPYAYANEQRGAKSPARRDPQPDRRRRSTTSPPNRSAGNGETRAMDLAAGRDLYPKTTRRLSCARP